MSAIALPPLTISQNSAAARLARQRWSANCAALGRHQPEVVERAGEFPCEREWVFARDHSLTCLNADGSWWAGCSVPRVAAAKLLKSLEPSSMVSAYLAPAYAELLHAARAQMGAEPALIAIVPTFETLRILLAGGNFAAEIGSHRLWFVAGDRWEDRLRALFENYPGLSPAGRFIRTKLTEGSVTEPMIVAAQTVLGDVASARSAAISRLQQLKPRTSETIDRLLTIVASRFRLWDDASAAVERAAAQFEETFGGSVVRFDSDDPLNASPLALASLAVDCGAVLAANVYRADAAGLVAPTTPWMTWVTRGAVPPFETAAMQDRLIVATPGLADAAAKSGWPASSIFFAEAIDRPRFDAAPTTPLLAIIADLAPVALPKSVEELSSQRLLWEFIDDEVDTNPFTIGDDPVGYLLGRAGEIGIAADEIDLRAFVDGLIVPRWQRAVARLIVAARMPLLIYGRGWGEDPAVAIAFAGELTDRETFERARAGATALVHLWPGTPDHPLDRTGATVVRPRASWAIFSESARQALAGRGSAGVKNVGLSTLPLRKLLDSVA